MFSRHSIKVSRVCVGDLFEHNAKNPSGPLPLHSGGGESRFFQQLFLEYIDPPWDFWGSAKNIHTPSTRWTDQDRSHALKLAIPNAFLSAV